jgi:hypothetical protein
VTKILRCACNHPVQDELHGKTNRVHNRLAIVSGSKPKWRCTVCSAVKEPIVGTADKRK